MYAGTVVLALHSQYCGTRTTCTVNIHYCGHPRDCDLVSLIARVHNGGNLFNSEHLFISAWDLAAVRIIRMSTRQELTVNQKFTIKLATVTHEKACNVSIIRRNAVNKL